MIDTQDKLLGIVDRYMQPMEKAGIEVIGFVFMGVAIQNRNVVAISITVDFTAIEV